MFLIAVPIAVLAFLATWLIPQVELQQWATPAATAAAAAPAAETQAAAVDAASGVDAVQAMDDASGTGVPSETLDPQEAGRADPRWGSGTD